MIVLIQYLGILHYLSLMQVEIIAKPHCNDQGIHNHLVYYRLNDISTMRISHETGFLGTLGTAKYIRRNKYGMVMNDNDEVYAAVHQFDHKIVIKLHMDQVYQIFIDDNSHSKTR